MNENPGVFLNSLTSAERKGVPIARALYAYFPDALALIARHSAISNEKHNPGQPIHWSREKSTDHEDCIARHSLSIAIDPDSLDDGQPHMICRAWRSLAALQLWAEERYGESVVEKGSAEVPATGWIVHDGGECPVPPTTLIEVQYANGELSRSNPAPARTWDWTRGFSDGYGIAAYRVVA